MKMRTILLSCYKELDPDTTRSVPLEVLEKCMSERDVTSEDFALELQAALLDGDFVFKSPGIITMTEAGTHRYANSLQLSNRN